MKKFLIILSFLLSGLASKGQFNPQIFYEYGYQDTNKVVKFFCTSVDTFTFELRYYGMITVTWGDGTKDTLTSKSTTVSDNRRFSHRYSGNYTGYFYITGNVGGVVGFYSSYNKNVSTTIVQFAKFKNNIELVVSGAQFRLTGTIAQTSRLLTRFECNGNNITVSGNLADLGNNLSRLVLSGNLINVQGTLADCDINFISIGTLLSKVVGNINTCPVVNTYLVLSGDSMFISGDIATDPANHTTLNLSGLNIAMTGDVKFARSTIINLVIVGSTYSSMTYTAGRVWANNMVKVQLYLASGMYTATEVDNLFIDLAAVATWAANSTIDMRGNNAPPTAASLTARNNLAARPVMVLTN